MDKKEEAKERLRDALTFMLLAVAGAKIHEPEGTVQLAIVVNSPNGGGRVFASMEAEDFFNDVGLASDFDPLLLAASKEGL